MITGEKEAVEQSAAVLKEAGARRVLPLKVSSPFHSPMMKPAGEKLEEVLKKVSVKDPDIPYVTNVTAEVVKSGKPQRTFGETGKLFGSLGAEHESNDRAGN